ncbi:hypothetical protein D3C85_884220 [compost metagenome]
MPGWRRRGHGTQPLHPQRPQFGDWIGFQGLVENARQFRLCRIDRKAIGCPHAFDTAPDLEPAIGFTPHHPVGADFTVYRRVSLPLAHQLAGLFLRVDQAQAYPRVSASDSAFQRMLVRQRQHSPRQFV